MEEFKVNIRKIDAHSEEIKDYGKRIRELQEGVSSIRGNLRHKLSSIEDIGKTLRKIEENLEIETVMMSGLGSVLGTIASDYRNSERRIVDFGAGSISGSQLSDLQKEALEYENVLENIKEEGGFVEVPRYYGGQGGPGKNAEYVSGFFRNMSDGCREMGWRGVADATDDIADTIDDVMHYMENGVSPLDMFGYGKKKAVESVINDEFDIQL